VPAPGTRRPSTRDHTPPKQETDLLLEGITLLSERQTALERRVQELESRLAQVEEQAETRVPEEVDAPREEERLTRLRALLDGLRNVRPHSPELTDGAARSDNANGEVAVVTRPKSASSAWQRLDRLPHLESYMIAVGLLLVLYVGLWQLALALGFA
jgi:hypothetical protein